MTLVTLPIEDITQIMLNLSYEDLNQIYNVNQLMRTICQDVKFWANKAQLDFSMPIQKFFTLVNSKSHPRESYLYLRQQLIDRYLNEIYKLGMYSIDRKGINRLEKILRKELGNYYPLPPVSIISRSTESSKLLTIAKINDIYHAAPICVKDLLQIFKVVVYDFNIRKFKYLNDGLVDMINMISSGKYHASECASKLIVSALHYLEGTSALHI